MPLLVALMEAPGIVVGIVLARALSGRQDRDRPLLQWGRLTHEVLFGKSVVLLLGGLVIGSLAGPNALAPIEPLFFGLFKGVLALFLLRWAWSPAVALRTCAARACSSRDSASRLR